MLLQLSGISGAVFRAGEMRNSFGACANSPNATFLAEKTMRYTKICNLYQCKITKIAMMSLLNKLMRSLESVFKFFKAWDKPKSLPPLIIALLPIFSLSAASQQAGGRGKADFKGFARDHSLCLPGVLGRDGHGHVPGAAHWWEDAHPGTGDLAGTCSSWGLLVRQVTPAGCWKSRQIFFFSAEISQVMQVFICVCLYYWPSGNLWR